MEEQQQAGTGTQGSGDWWKWWGPWPFAAAAAAAAVLAAHAYHTMVWPLLRRSNSTDRQQALTPLEKLKGYYDLAKVCGVFVCVLNCAPCPGVCSAFIE